MAPEDQVKTDLRDVQAVRKVLAGDRSAFRELVTRYTDPIYSLAYRMTGSFEDAQEAVQEIFAKVYQKLNSYDPDRRFFTWVYTVALNHLRSLGRSNKRKGKGEVLSLDVGLDRVVSSSTEGSPEGHALRSEAGQLIERALRQLREEHRTVFVLRHMEHLEVREVAEVTGLPENTVKTHDRRAKQKLREIIISYGWK